MIYCTGKVCSKAFDCEMKGLVLGSLLTWHYAVFSFRNALLDTYAYAYKYRFVETISISIVYSIGLLNSNDCSIDLQMY